MMTFDRWCVCPIGVQTKNTQIAEHQAYHRQRWERQTSIAWGMAHIPKRFLGFRFRSSPVDQAIKDRMLLDANAETYPEQAAASWYLWGLHGCGKTGLAVSYLRHYLEIDGGYGDEPAALFTSVPDLLAKLRSTYNRQPREGEENQESEEQVMESYLKARLLVLDDLGAEQITSTGWAEDRLYRIVGNRHAELRPTVFTSNLSLERLAARVGERITWRIVEMCGADHVVELKGPNLRDVAPAAAGWGE